MPSKHKHKNKLVVFRRRAGLTQREVARLLGHRRTTLISSYETGRALPPLPTALRIGIILRVPLEFLYGTMYDEMRLRIRADEERMTALKVGTIKSHRASAE